MKFAIRLVLGEVGHTKSNRDLLCILLLYFYSNLSIFSRGMLPYYSISIHLSFIDSFVIFEVNSAVFSLEIQPAQFINCCLGSQPNVFKFFNETSESC